MIKYLNLPYTLIDGTVNTNIQTLYTVYLRIYYAVTFRFGCQHFFTTKQMSQQIIVDESPPQNCRRIRREIQK